MKKETVTEWSCVGLPLIKLVEDLDIQGGAGTKKSILKWVHKKVVLNKFTVAHRQVYCVLPRGG